MPFMAGRIPARKSVDNSGARRLLPRALRGATIALIKKEHGHFAPAGQYDCLSYPREACKNA